MAAARDAKGTIGSIPARLWWPASLLVLTDTALNFRELLAAKSSAYDPQSGRLNPPVVAAVNAISGRFRKLFPWPWDANRRFETLARRFEDRARAAGPPVGPRLLDTLCATGRRSPDVVNRLDLTLPFDGEILRHDSKKVRRGEHLGPEGLLRITFSHETLAAFFLESSMSSATHRRTHRPTTRQAAVSAVDLTPPLRNKGDRLGS